MELGAATGRIQEGHDRQFLSAVMDMSGATPMRLNLLFSKQYSYLASVPLLVVFSTSMTTIKVREGVSRKPLRILRPQPFTPPCFQGGLYFRTDQVRGRCLIEHRRRNSPAHPAVIPRPVQLYSDSSRALLLPLYFLFAGTWALEM